MTTWRHRDELNEFLVVSVDEKDEEIIAKCWSRRRAKQITTNRLHVHELFHTIKLIAKNPQGAIGLDRLIERIEAERLALGEDVVS